jgi:hypothetical protein
VLHASAGGGPTGAFTEIHRSTPRRSARVEPEQPGCRVPRRLRLCGRDKDVSVPPSGTTLATPPTAPPSTHGGSPSRTEPRLHDRHRSKTARRRSGIPTSGRSRQHRRPKKPRGGSCRPSVHSFGGAGRTFAPPIEHATHLPIPLARDALSGVSPFLGIFPGTVPEGGWS